MDIGQRKPLQERGGATSKLKDKHHTTTANCPWSNGTIESGWKQVIQAFRSVLSELNMYADEWLEVVNMASEFDTNNGSTTFNIYSVSCM
jgi:hypothetical protein